MVLSSRFAQSRSLVRRVIGVGLATLLLLAAVYYRLAFTPDRFVAASIQRKLEGAVGLENIQRILSRQYSGLSVGLGDGRSWDPTLPALHSAHSIQLLVGEYRALFVTSVEALIVVDEGGRVRAVLVRRTTLGI